MSNSRPKSRICASSLLKHLRNIRCFASVPSRNYHLSRKLIITGRLINGPCTPGSLTAIKKEQGSIPASLNPEVRCSDEPVTTNLLSLFAVAKISHKQHRFNIKVGKKTMGRTERPAHPHHKDVYISVIPEPIFFTCSLPTSDASHTTSCYDTQVHQSVADVQAAAP